MKFFKFQCIQAVVELVSSFPKVVICCGGEEMSNRTQNSPFHLIVETAPNDCLSHSLDKDQNLCWFFWLSFYDCRSLGTIFKVSLRPAVSFGRSLRRSAQIFCRRLHLHLAAQINYGIPYRSTHLTKTRSSISLLRESVSTSLLCMPDLSPGGSWKPLCFCM